MVGWTISDVRLRCKCWRKGGSGVGKGGGGAMAGRRRMERRVSGRMKLPLELARCGRGRTGTAPGVGVALGMPVSFCTISRKSLGLVSKIVVGVRRDARGRRLLAERDEDCCDDDVVTPVGSLNERPVLSPKEVDCGSDVRQSCSV